MLSVATLPLGFFLGGKKCRTCLHHAREDSFEYSIGLEGQNNFKHTSWETTNIVFVYELLFFCVCQAINAMELNMEALKEIQTMFYNDFPPHEKEKLYKFATPSTIKPTKWSCMFKFYLCFLMLQLFSCVS
jgi:hypothetical protein